MSRLSVALSLLVALLLVGGCSAKSEQDLANDALQAGLAAHAAGNLDQAAADYRETLKHDPNNKFAYFDLGVIAQTRKQNADAETDYRSALAIDGDFESALFNLAIVRAVAKDPTEAIDLYRHVIVVNPKNAAAHFNLGILLRQTGDQSDGDTEVATATHLDPTLHDPATSGSGPSASPGASQPAGSTGASASP